MKDKFTQLVDDMVSGEIGWNLLQMAMRQSIRKRKDIPEGIKDLLAGRSEADSGLISKMFMPISHMIGNMELAYRRGTDEISRPRRHGKTNSSTRRKTA